MQRAAVSPCNVSRNRFGLLYRQIRPWSILRLCKKKYEHLGGRTIRVNLLTRNQDVHYPTDGKPRRMAWKVARHDYDIVNLNQQFDLVFNQWGVSKRTNNGWYSCKMCTSTPRHCAHNKALLGTDDGQGEFPPRTRSPKDVAEESISSMLDKDTKKMKPP